MSNTNEMINLPMITPTEAGAAGAEHYELPVEEPSVVMGAPYTAWKPEDVTVYANSINPVSSMGSTGSPVVAFDVVFSVGINCGEGQCKTYQVVKRIGIDKCKMAADAESSTPVSIVESKKPGVDTAKRFRILAGLE